MSRLFRAVIAAVALVALVVGVPAALVRFVGRPWPRPMPSFDTIWSAIRAGDISDTTVIKALAIVVWIAWARLALSVLVEVLARLGGRPAPHIAVLGSAQHWAAAMIAAVVVVGVGVAPRPAMASRAADSPRPIPAALLQSDRDEGRLPNRHQRQFEHASAVDARASATGAHQASQAAWTEDRARPLDRGHHRVASDVTAGAPGGAAAGAEMHTTVHVVRRYESFWSIAEDTLGDGSRWREIVELNNGRQVAPDVVFDGTANRLLPGWALVVPTPSADPNTDAPVLPAEPAPDSSRRVTVAPGDTLSGIAADQLGDANQWPVLWETNRGQDFGGRVFDDPNMIVAGWELIVPDVFAPPAPAPAAPAAEVAAPPVVPPVVEPPIAAVEAPAAPAPTPVADLPDAVPVAVVPAPVFGEPTSPNDTLPDDPLPDDTLPDDTLPTVTMSTDTMPTVNMPTVTGPGVASLPPPVVVPSVVGEPLGDLVDAPRDLAERDNSTAALGGMGAAMLLASGVIGAVGVRRRRQLRGAAINARLAEPSPMSVRVEHGLRRLGSDDRIARLDIALRAAARALLDASPGTVILGAMMTDDGQLDLLLSGASPAAPAPWTIVTAHRWRLPASVGLTDLADAARQSNQPCPAMAHLGSTMIDELRSAELFVDLEAIGLLTVDGPPLESTAIVRALAAGVAVSPLAEIAHLIISGLDIPPLGHPSTHAADSVDVALDLAAGAIGVTAAMTAGATSTFVLRARHLGGEAWEPAIVVASQQNTDSPHDSISDADLVDLAGAGGRGLAVVVDRAVTGATWTIRPGSHQWCLHPLELQFTPIGLSATDVDRIESLLHDADRPLLFDGHQLGEAGTGPATDSESSNGGAVPDQVDELPWALMVRLLGPVEVMSADLRTVAFERSKALELVVWLAQHRDRSTRTGARTALWESNVRDATFANVVSDARRNLARLAPPAEGEEWVGRTLTEELPLHALVVTDADVLDNRLRAAARLQPEAAIATLRPALSLIRDMPFSGTSYLWPDSEGITSQLTLLATSAATVLAGHYLSIGDTEGVFWATGQGLKVLSGHEELISLRMRAHGRQGDLAGVRLEWEQYQRVLHAEAWSDGEPSPKLVALRRELLSLR